MNTLLALIVLGTLLMALSVAALEAAARRFSQVLNRQLPM